MYKKIGGDNKNIAAKTDNNLLCNMLKTGVKEFVALTRNAIPILDVRSPGEYAHAHIPGAYNLPLFTDEERKLVGTAYKQEGRETAIKIGLDYYGTKMRKIVETVEQIIEANGEALKASGTQPTDRRTVMVHCWRGGMRSAAVAWLLDLYGFKVVLLTGGYKAYRNWVLQQFELLYPIKMLGGYTGSGKTEVLKELAKTETVIDLERLANHKGSAFGDLGEPASPSPEMFENMLAMQLNAAQPDQTIWLEDESRRIGDINLPEIFWNNMRKAPVYFLEVPFEQRLDYITAEYGKFKKEELVKSIIRIQKRLGGLNTKNAINYLLENNSKECFRILLNYYDKFYKNGLNSRANLSELLTTIPCDAVNAKVNCYKLKSTSLHKDGKGNGGN